MVVINIKKIAAIIFLIFVVSLSVDLKISAMSTGFETEDMRPKDQELFLSNIKMTLLDSCANTYPIACFDVSDEGLIALGFDDSSHKAIYVYNAEGKFEYGYSFESDGGFGVEWDDDNLIIYFVRSDVAALFNKNAACLEMKSISSTIENNTYWNTTVFGKKRFVGKIEYEINNDIGILNFFASSNSQLIKTDATGLKTTLYNVNGSYGLKLFLILVSTILFIVLVIFIIFRQFRIIRMPKN